MLRGSYLMRRPDSQYWQLQLVFPKDFEFDETDFHDFRGRKHFTMSLRTADRAQAEIHAAPYVHRFKVALYRWRNRKAKEAFVQREGYRYADGLQIIDGFQAVVMGPTITFFGLDGKPVRTEANPKVQGIEVPLVADEETAQAFRHFDRSGTYFKLPERFEPKTNPDDEVIEEYIRHKRLKPSFAHEARVVWQTYKDIVGKPLNKATRADGKKLADHFFGLGNARATVQKKITWLSASVNHAMKERDSKLTFNPFSAVVPPKKRGDAGKRTPFTEADMAALWAALPTLSQSDQLLWRLLAKSGMRLGEAMSLTGEDTERGGSIRRVLVGTKTDASERHLPLPLDIGLPEKVSRKLFPGTATNASKRLNAFVKRVIPDADERGLVVHCLRHRMADVVRALRIGDHYERRFLGHASPDVHGQYGSSVPLEIALDVMNANPIDGTFKKPGVLKAA